MLARVLFQFESLVHRKRAKCLDYEAPLLPTRFDKRISNYLNAECFRDMIAKDYVFPAGGPEAKTKLLEDLDAIIDDTKFLPRVSISNKMHF